MKTYTTIQGDTWDGIAYSQLGSTAHMDKLMNVNHKYINYFVFPSGVVLTLPEIPDEVDDTMPPWKKVSE